MNRLCNAPQFLNTRGLQRGCNTWKHSISCSRYEDEVERPSKRHCSDQPIAETSWEDRSQEIVRYHELQPPLPPMQYISSSHNAHYSHASTQMSHPHVSTSYAQYQRYVPGIETWPHYM